MKRRILYVIANDGCITNTGLKRTDGDRLTGSKYLREMFRL